MKLIQTAERVSQTDKSDNCIYQRSLFAYLEAAKLIHGNVLEIGTGSGYGIEYIAQNSTKFITIDKHRPTSLSNETLICSDQVRFIKMKVPPLLNVPDNYFDFVISFQVIEHIKDDSEFIKEAYRVLKPGGRLILTTPNIKSSLTRNPWHIREYTIAELEARLKSCFSTINKLGVYGNEKVQDYTAKNKAAIQKITRFDVFNLQYKLPRQILTVPYDLLNRLNRQNLLSSNEELTTGITTGDYYLDLAKEDCLDLFYVAVKGGF